MHNSFVIRLLLLNQQKRMKSGSKTVFNICQNKCQMHYIVLYLCFHVHVHKKQAFGLDIVILNKNLTRRTYINTITKYRTDPLYRALN